MEKRDRARVRALIFDMDGTLADTLGALTEGVNMALEHAGYPHRTETEIRSFIGNGARMLVTRALPEGAKDETTVGRVYNDYLRCYRAVTLHTRVLYDGLGEVIARLSRHYLIGVLSNKEQIFLEPLATQLLEGFCPAEKLFIRGTVPELPTKPDARLGASLLERMGVAPDECVMIGDSDVDVQTAKNLGCAHVGVTWGFRSEEFLREHGAVVLVHTPDELEKTITAGEPFR